MTNSRDALLRAGLDLFTSKGHYGTSIDKVLSKAGHSKGVFYHYFESKEAFVMEILDIHIHSIMRETQETFDYQDLNSMEKLQAYFWTYVSKFEDGDLAFGLLIPGISVELLESFVSVQTKIEQYLLSLLEIFSTCIAAGQLDGTIKNRKPADQLAQHLISAWEGALLCDRFSNSSHGVRTFFLVALDSLCHE